MKKAAFFCLVLCTSFLFGCGGGGGATNGSVAQGTAEGVYTGTNSIGHVSNPIKVLVLETGEVFGIYGIEDGFGRLTVYGAVTGTATTSNGIFSVANALDYYRRGSARYTAILQGTYVTGASLSGTITETTANTSVTSDISASTPVATNYVYNKAASVQEVSKAWSGVLSGNTGTNNQTQPVVNFSVANGTISGATTSGCNVAGSLSPRASGKNVFDASVTLTDASGNCPVQLIGTHTGIGIIYTIASGKQLILIADSGEFQLWAN